MSSQESQWKQEDEEKRKQREMLNPEPELWRVAKMSEFRVQRPEAAAIVDQLLADSDNAIVYVRDHRHELLSDIHLLLNFSEVAYIDVTYDFGSGAFVLRKSE